MTIQVCRYLYSGMLLCFVFAAGAAFGQLQPVSAKQGEILIKTYPYADPNPIAPLAVNSKISRFYPYFMFDGYTAKDTLMPWNVITLDNGLITVKVLPQLGGKVYGATENAGGEAFVYLNEVIKFRAIGSRGPWTSGGIEHNFGLDIGHAPWAASPVDYIVKKNPDGSVDCVVGGLDLASRSEWRVTVRLPQHAAYFETRGFWYNPTPLHLAYLSWENAAFRASDDLAFYFPGEHFIGHNGEAGPWPVSHDGRDMSLYRNNNFGSSKSYHVMGAARNWFGGIWQDKHLGFAHWAPYSDAPGKKLWIWSLARDGAIWKDLLTDANGQYIEAQSGANFNQPDLLSGFHSPFKQLNFRPGYTETKNEIWAPVKGLRGMSDATAWGSLYVTRRQDRLQVWISPNVSLKDSLVISVNGKPHNALAIDLQPLQTWHRSFALPATEKGTISVSLGKGKLYYSSNASEGKLGRPVTSADWPRPHDAEREFLLGEDKNSMRLFEEALQHYRACLEKEPGHMPALARIAELLYRRGDDSAALAHAARALGINTYDGGANYIYGIIQRKTGDLQKAAEAFSVAVRTIEFRSAAYTALAGISMQQQDHANVVMYAARALEYNRNNLDAWALLGTGYRKQGDTAQALQTFDRLLEIDPLSHYGRYEKYLLRSAGLDAFKGGITNEFPHETYLEMAMRYVRNGLEEDAAQLLEQAPAYPVVYYWLAFLKRNSAPAESSAYLERANTLSPKFVFPFREETAGVLQWAAEQKGSWKPGYYLALLYWHMGQLSRSKALFAAAGNTPDFAYFYLTRSALFAADSAAPVSPLHDMQKAMALEPQEWRSHHLLTEYFARNNEAEKALEAAGKAVQLFPGNPVTGMDHAKMLLNNGQFEQCAAALKKLLILPQEGAQEGHQLFEEAWLSMAMEKLAQKDYRTALRYIDTSRKWPEHLGSGKPYDPDNRLQDYLAAFCETKRGNRARAAKFTQAIKTYTLKQWPEASTPFNNYIGLSIMQASADSAMAAPMLSSWTTKLDSLQKWAIPSAITTPEFRWVTARFNKEDERRKIAEQEILNDRMNRRNRLFLQAVKIIEGE